MPGRPSTSAGAALALAFGVVAIGWSAIFVKLAAVPGVSAGFYRLLFAAVALTPFWIASRPLAPGRHIVRLCVVCGALFAGDLALWNGSLLRTSAANATLLANLAPLWVGLGAAFVFRERLPNRFWRGMLLSLLGAAVIAAPWQEGAAPNYGDLMAIGASLFYASYLLTTRRARAHVDTVTFMVLAMWSGVLILGAACLVTGAPLTGFSPESWRALAGLGLVSQLGGWLAISYALGHFRAPVTSVTLLGQPVLTAVFAAVVLGEAVTTRTALGGALILTGIFLVAGSPRSADRDSLSETGDGSAHGVLDPPAGM
jgi:drug/metabolite transporter (DMT)-like permease